MLTKANKIALSPGHTLAGQIDLIKEKCIECPKCITQCAFLKEHGNPRQIAAAYDPGRTDKLILPFMCNLCDLCAAVCPVQLTPGQMFLEMRREAVTRGMAPLPEHKGIMWYEHRGVSAGYSWYSLPRNCTTVLFPGCTFAGTRMDTTLALYKHLKTHMPDMGIVLDCCTKPSHDLGRQDYFNAMLGEMKHWLVEQGVTAVMAVCPNCYKVFKKYGSPLTVISVYEFLAENGLPSIDLNHANCCDSSTIAAIHDPCVLRYEPDIQQAVRQLAVSRHFTLEEMPHSKNKTVCCGEGGTVEAVTPEFSRIWRSIRKAEAGNRHLLTYCAGCAVLLNKQTPTDHILDAMFYPRAVAAGKRKVTSPPFTYWNRIRLKRHIQKHYPDPVTRERRFQPEPVTAGSKIGKLLKFLLSGFER